MNNPQAFPFPAYTYPNGEFNQGEDGMSLRDYFAAKAMQGIYASNPSLDWTTEDIVREAYCSADAMLKARKA